MAPAEPNNLAVPLLLKLAEADNIAVAVRALPAGTTALGVTLRQDVAVGHKVALTHISTGQKVLKWAMPIGSATRDIQPGEHVHTHNLQSDYLPTFTLDSGRRFVEVEP